MASDEPARRLNYSEAPKAQVMAECEAPGTSVAKVALVHGIKANVVHRWRQLAREDQPAVPATSSGFIPVSLAPSPIPPVVPASSEIQVQLRRGATTMSAASIASVAIRGITIFPPFDPLAEANLWHRW